MAVVMWLFGGLIGALAAWLFAAVADAIGFQPIGGIWVCAALFGATLFGALLATGPGK